MASSSGASRPGGSPKASAPRSSRDSASWLGATRGALAALAAVQEARQAAVAPTHGAVEQGLQGHRATGLEQLEQHAVASALAASAEAPWRSSQSTRAAGRRRRSPRSNSDSQSLPGVASAS
jgi:hypothetical protein